MSESFPVNPSMDDIGPSDSPPGRREEFQCLECSAVLTWQEIELNDEECPECGGSDIDVVLP